MLTLSPSPDLSKLRTEKRTKSADFAELEDEGFSETSWGAVDTVRRGLLRFGGVSGIGRDGMRKLSMGRS